MKAPRVLMPRLSGGVKATKHKALSSNYYSFYTHIMMTIFDFAACRQNPESQRNLKIDYDYC